jgi:RNA polymerase sigma-70 factor, ECF subfamily
MDAAQLANVIARARRRDPAAFESLVDLYGPRLYGYFYRFTGSRHEAEDLLQETFIRMVRMIGTYEHNGRFDGWIFCIATNLVRDRVRRVKSAKAAGLYPTQAAEDENEYLSNCSDDSVGELSARLEQAEQVDQLQKAIAQLPEPEREVILLRHFSQLSFREIADQMQTPLGTALARAHRGLARLREMMEKTG